MSAKQLWAFTLKHSILHFNNAPVSDVIAATTEENVVKIYYESQSRSESSCCRCPVEYFLSDSKYFESLCDCHNAKEFVSILTAVMKKHKLLFCYEYDEANNSNTTEGQQKKKRKIFNHRHSFQEEIEVLHNLHPMAGNSESEPLNSKDKIWRANAINALNYDKYSSEGNFGGLFKEQLFVSTMSDRCYKVAEEIMNLYGEKQLKEQRNQKVNRSLFSGFVGIREEKVIYDLLIQFRNGHFSKEEINEKALNYKKVQPAKSKETPQPNLRQENFRLRLENADLRMTISTLQSKIEKLETELEAVKVDRMEEDTDRRNVDAIDPFLFSDEEYNPVIIEYDNEMTRCVVSQAERCEEASEENAECMYIEVQSTENSADEDDQHVANEEGSTFDAEAELLKTYKIIEGYADSGEEKSKTSTSSEEKEEAQEPKKPQKNQAKKQKTQVKYKEKEQTKKFKLDERVLAKWTDKQFYQAKIMKIVGDKYQVLFFDGYKRTVGGKDIKRR